MIQLRKRNSVATTRHFRKVGNRKPFKAERQELNKYNRGNELCRGSRSKIYKIRVTINVSDVLLFNYLIISILRNIITAIILLQYASVDLVKSQISPLIWKLWFEENHRQIRMLLFPIVCRSFLYLWKSRQSRRLFSSSRNSSNSTMLPPSMDPSCSDEIVRVSNVQPQRKTQLSLFHTNFKHLLCFVSLSNCLLINTLRNAFRIRNFPAFQFLRLLSVCESWRDQSLPYALKTRGPKIFCIFTEDINCRWVWQKRKI